MNATLSSYAQTQPWKILQSPVNVTLRKLTFVDSLTGWAAGEAGTIIRTTDGGIGWDVQNSSVQTFIMDIFFVDKNIGWALTLKDEFPFNSVILKTTNGGDDWSAENFPDSSKYIRTIFFFDSLNGFVGGSYIGYTSDGGNTWTSAVIDSNMISGFPVFKFNFLNRQFGYACGGRIDVAGVVWRTTESGLNWSAQGVSADEIFDVFIFDSLNAITLSGDPEGLYPIAKITTSNSGETWSNEDLPFFGLSFAIDYRTYNEGWSASGYKFLLTTNRGETWSEFDTPDSTVVYDLQFLDARTGYAVGENGVILKLDPALVGVKEEILLQDEFILGQNYPNPFNPSTKISWQTPVGGWQTLKIFDILGNELATLLDEYRPAGKYEVEFSPAFGIGQLASGIYFYQLKSDIFFQTKKMIYLK
ncbi:MAG: YCF48-related protein [Ignavibacteria bacterium]|nr:YCF48-related protein [Ignavibacteria bacterium]